VRASGAESSRSPARCSLTRDNTAEMAAHVTTLTFILVGATGSLGLMLYVGRHNASNLLLALFAGWVLLPFAALGFAAARSRRWPSRAQAGLNLLAAVMALASLAIYGSIAFGPPRPRPAFAFLIVPLISLILIVIFCGRRWYRR
jgi:nitric oxide reductase large subunit